MKLARLKLGDLRNLAEVDIEPSPRLNLIYGANASGKTSLLEAIHLLGLARSFRTLQNRPLIRHGQEDLLLFGLIDPGASKTRIGIRKGFKGQTEIHINGQLARSSAQLAALLPLQLITPASHALLESGRKQRRAFIDWSLFHVKHHYLEVWQRYGRIVRQRNAALRNRESGVESASWDPSLLEYGHIIDQARREYVQDFVGLAGPYIDRLLEGQDIGFSYYPGWPRDRDLAQALEDSRERERSLGYTTVGPHCADLRIRQGDRPAVESLSRGQQKLLVCAMRLAQLSHLRRETGKTGVVLIDDLPSELDLSHRRRLLTLLEATGAQVFVTATEKEQIDTQGWSEVKVFHVEHGQVREVVQ